MNKTILIVEDEEDLVSMMKFQFEANGYAVVSASNGVEGLSKLSRIQPDLIILDLNMPKVGGIEFCHRIALPDGTLKYPVMVLTARAHTEEIMKEFKLAGFMTKPFKIEQLLKQVEDIINRK